MTADCHRFGHSEGMLFEEVRNFFVRFVLQRFDARQIAAPGLPLEHGGRLRRGHGSPDASCVQPNATQELRTSIRTHCWRKADVVLMQVT